MEKFHKLRPTKNKFHKLRPMKQKFHKLKPTKNKIDWSTTSSETTLWHWDLASLLVSDLESRCFGLTDQTHADQRPTPIRTQTHKIKSPCRTTTIGPSDHGSQPMTIAKPQPLGERREK